MLFKCWITEDDETIIICSFRFFYIKTSLGNILSQRRNAFSAESYMMSFLFINEITFCNSKHLKCCNFMFLKIIYSMPSKVTYHPYNLGVVTSIFIKMVPRFSKAAMRFLMKPSIVPPCRERYQAEYQHSYFENKKRQRSKVIYKVVENHRFHTKRYLVEINANNTRIKMRTCFFVIF